MLTGISLNLLQPANLLSLPAVVQPVAPSAPTVTVVAGSGQLTISWVDGYNGGAPISGHNLYVGTSSGGESATAILISGASPYVLTGLTNGQIEYLQMTAVNSVGEGARSTEVSGTPRVVIRNFGVASLSQLTVVDGSNLTRGTAGSSNTARSK